jgi:hypothetical protein
VTRMSDKILLIVAQSRTDNFFKFGIFFAPTLTSGPAGVRAGDVVFCAHVPVYAVERSPPRALTVDWTHELTLRPNLKDLRRAAIVCNDCLSLFGHLCA